MPKINVYLPDELAEAVKEAGVPVSAVCQRALEQAVRRITAIRVTAFGNLNAEDPTGRLAQFTERAKAVLKLAVEQARAAGAATVGTEHLLGAMVAEGSNLALHVLRAIDIDPATLAESLADTTRDATADTTTDTTAAATAAATADTTRDATADTTVDTSRDATTDVSADVSAARGVKAAGAESARHFSAEAAAALELTVGEATGLGHNYVGCEHLLLGLVSEPDGAAGQTLRGLGADLRLTRRAVTAALAGYVHLRAQTGLAQTGVAQTGVAQTGLAQTGLAQTGLAQTGLAQTGAAQAGAAQALIAAVRAELQPLIARIERLEARAGG